MVGAVAPIVAATLLVVGGSGFVVVAQATPGAHESPAVRSELSHFVARNTPVVSEQGGYGGKGPAPAITGTLVEKYTTATSDTYRRPDGRMITRVYANPVNFMDESGHWQPIAGSADGLADVAGAGSLAQFGSAESDVAHDGFWNDNCTLTSTEPEVSRCQKDEMSAGYEAATGKINRGLVSFTLPQLGPNPQILYAQFGLYLEHSTTTAAAAMGMYRATSEWGILASWNHRTSGGLWGTPGGDYSNGGDAVVNPSVGAATGWAYWYPTTMFQEWYKGPSAPNGEGASNFGLLLKDVSEGSVNNDLTFDTEGDQGEDEPMLTLEWVTPGKGEQSQFTLLREPLTDKMSLAVNAASGDLSITNDDLEIAGRGLDFSAARTWNSFSEYGEQYGDGWAGNFQYLRAQPDGSVTYANQSGAEFLFIKNGSSFLTPAGIEALMCAAGSPHPCPTTLPSGTSYQLIYDKSQTHVNFGPPNPSEGEISDPIEVVDRYGDSLKAGYTAGFGQPTSWTDTEGRKIVSELEKEVGPLKITDESGGRTLKFAYEGGHLITYTDADGKQTKYKYVGNLITQITTPRGEVVELFYDGEDRVTKIIRTTSTGGGPTTTFEYDEAGKAPSPCTSAQAATIVKDPDWTAAKAHETIYCTNSLDEVEQTVDANGNATETSYDPFGNVTATTASAPGNGESGDVESLGYDKTGVNLECVVTGTTSKVTTCPATPDKSALVTSYSYTDTVNPFSATQVQNPEGKNQFACYNDGVQEEGKQKEIIGTECPKPSEATGPAGSLQNENDQLSTEHELKFAYNEHGQVTSATDADGHATTYEYEEKGNLTKITPPAKSEISPTTITVDADSRPHVIKDGAGHIETITYNADDEITEIAYTGTGTARTVKFEYDADGNLIKREDPTGTTKYTVDPLNRVTKEELPGSLSNSYEYDAASNMTAFTDGGGTTKYKYNGLNELESMLEPGETKETKFTYDNDHRLNKITYTSGAIENYQLESTTGRPETITAEGVTGTTVPKLTYAYKEGADDTSLVQSLTESTGNTTSYLYDKLNRLREAKTKSTTDPSHYSYELNGAGNRTSQEVSTTAETGGTKTYYVLNSGNELECRQTVTGACSKKTSTELSGYKYDEAGEETEITPEGDTSGTTFAYNAARETSSLTPSGSSALALSYGGTGQDDLTALGSSTTLQSSLLGITREVSSAGTSYYARTPTGLLIDERTPSGHFNPLYDGQGDIIALVNSSGKVERTFRYGPYGENVKSEGTQTIPYPFGYKGGYRMPGGNKGEGNVTNGLYHYGERYYDPTTGRWTQQDPTSHLGSATQGDLFSFAGSDPINLADPSGESWLSNACAAAAVWCGLHNIGEVTGTSGEIEQAGEDISLVEDVTLPTVEDLLREGVEIFESDV
jgi:RHS repeat-associated protein